MTKAHTANQAVSTGVFSLMLKEVSMVTVLSEICQTQDNFQLNNPTQEIKIPGYKTIFKNVYCNIFFPTEEKFERKEVTS